ncbi:MAG: hypothetical protein JW794_09335 [Candidatus Cloacimonetes bacterium]|nr:hypothetical protein [Candidatus Cloacimonadota bacterium]
MKNHSELLYRIFKEDAEIEGMNMRTFYHKRRNGLYPFRSTDGKVHWLKNNEFRIVAVLKRLEPKKIVKKEKHIKHSSRHHHKSKPKLESVTIVLFSVFGIILFFGILKIVQLLIGLF